MRLLFPTSIRLNRGNTVLPQLAQSCLATSVTDLILLHEHRGVPTVLTVSHFPHGPTASFSLHNVVLRHDIDNSARGTVSEAYPHLIFEGFKTPLGKRVVTILKHLFPPGVKNDSARVVTFALTEGDFISVRHHVYVKTGPKTVELAEVGPRMEMKVFNSWCGSHPMVVGCNWHIWVWSLLVVRGSAWNSGQQGRRHWMEAESIHKNGSKERCVITAAIRSWPWERYIWVSQRNEQLQDSDTIVNTMSRNLAPNKYFSKRRKNKSIEAHEDKMLDVLIYKIGLVGWANKPEEIKSERCGNI